MKLDSLKPLLHHRGPLTTVCLDVTRADEAGDRDLRGRWNGLRRDLAGRGAPDQTLDVIEEAVLRPTHVAGRHGRYLVASGDRILYDRVLADAPIRDEAFHNSLPSLLPAVRAADEAVRYLLVEVDRQGADLSWSPTESHAPETDAGQVEGGHDVLHKVRSGGWSHRRMQSRVEDSWERNAEAVAAELERVVVENRPELVVLTGDVRATALLREEVGHATAEVLVEVPGGSRADGVNEDAFAAKLAEVLRAFRARRRETVVGRMREALGRGEGAVTELGDVVDVLRRGQVDELLLVRNAAGDSVAHLNERSLWVGPDPMQVAVSRGDLSSLGVANGDAQQLRADIAVLRAALAQDAGFTFAPEGSVNLVGGVGALLRWTDAATPHETASAYGRSRRRRDRR